MACGSGCTDCPTCRGEVLPDSPVMKDMEFAMAMHGEGMLHDRVMGPFAVIQTVRDAVRQRGQGTPEERTILKFLEDQVGYTSLRGERDPIGHNGRWTGTAELPLGGYTVSPWCGPGILCDADDKPAGNPGPANPPAVPGVGTKKLTDEEKELILKLIGGKSQQPALISVDEFDKTHGAPICCVDIFEAPKSWSKWITPVSGRDGKVKGANIGVWFSAIALFSSVDACECKCCEYRQYARVEGEYTVNGGSKKWPTQEWIELMKSKNQLFAQDCKWFYPGDDPEEQRQPGRSGNLSYSVPPPGTVIQCYGIKDGQPGSLNERAYQPREATKYPNKQDVLEAECWFSLRDKPSFGIDVPSTFRMRYQYIGVIWSVCPPGGIVDARRWELNFEGSTSLDATGKLVVTPVGQPQPTPGGQGGGGWVREQNLDGSYKSNPTGTDIGDNAEPVNPTRPWSPR